MIQAVAIIFQCNNKIFTIKRQNSLRVFPGYHSFPGGKVDKADSDRQSMMPDVSSWENPFMNALNREVEEEVGISLEDLFAKGEIERPRLFGQAMSPPFNPYKFDTYYYLLQLKSEMSFKIEVAEIEYGTWDSAQNVLSYYQQGKILCVPPFIKILKTIRDGSWCDVTERGLYDFSLQINTQKMIPMIEPVYGLKHFFVESITLPPAYFTNCFLIDGILVDPSPKDEQTLKKLLASLEVENVRMIFITHHHRDHLNLAHSLARTLEIPVMMSERTHELIKHKRGKDTFNECSVEYVSDGEQIGSWLGQPLMAMHVPGHDNGQFALHSEDYQWFIAGDLFQFGATVVVGDIEGDMGEYQTTLQKIIDLSPNVIFPSHGIGVYGTNRLEKTLDHTKIRNRQVKDLHDKGASIDEMLATIYKGIPQELLRYARKNIVSHLKLLGQQDS